MTKVRQHTDPTPARDLVILALCLLLLCELVYSLHWQQEGYHARTVLRVAVPRHEWMRGAVPGFGPGFEQELLDTFCREGGMRWQRLTPDSWGEAWAMLRDDRADVVLGLGSTPPDDLADAVAEGPAYASFKPIIIHNDRRYGVRKDCEMCDRPILVSANANLKDALDAKADDLDCTSNAVISDGLDIVPLLDTLGANEARFALMDEDRFRLWQPFYHRLRKSRALPGSIAYRWCWNTRDKDLGRALDAFWIRTNKSPRLADVAAQGAQTVLAFSGREVPAEQLAALRAKNVHAFHKAAWSAPGDEALRRQWAKRAERAVDVLAASRELREYLAVLGRSLFEHLGLPALATELTRMVPVTVVELARAERITAAFRPDVVLAHFSIHPTEACNVLPARARGVPTLTYPHGAAYETGMERKVFSAEYFACHGPRLRESYAFALGVPEDVVRPMGRPRKALRDPVPDRAEAKRAAGLDPERPVCLFCDVSGFPQTLEHRHSTRRTVQEALRLKRDVPGLQLVYRVHAGPDYTTMRRHFEALSDEDVHSQISPNPLFSEMLPAADVVVSHQSSTIAESLLAGVRVVYLCALSRREPGYSGCGAVLTADSFETLAPLVRRTLDEALDRQAVRELAGPYLDRKLGSAKLDPDRELARFMLELALRGPDPARAGYGD